MTYKTPQQQADDLLTQTLLARFEKPTPREESAPRRKPSGNSRRIVTFKIGDSISQWEDIQGG